MNTEYPAQPSPTTSLIVGEVCVEKNIKADRPNKAIVFFSHIAQIDSTIFSENRPTTKTMVSKSLNESCYVRQSIDMRAALVAEGNVPYSTTADCHASKELNGEKTNDLVFSGFEMRGTIKDKKKHEQDVSSSKNMVAVFLRRSQDTAQEEGDTSDPKSITANVEILLSPAKDEVLCAASVSLYKNKKIAHTLLTSK